MYINLLSYNNFFIFWARDLPEVFTDFFFRSLSKCMSFVTSINQFNAENENNYVSHNNAIFTTVRKRN